METKILNKTNIIYIDFFFLDNFQIFDILSIMNNEFQNNYKEISFVNDIDKTNVEKRTNYRLNNVEKYILKNNDISFSITPCFIELIFFKEDETIIKSILMKLNKYIKKSNIQITNFSLNTNLIVLFKDLKTLENYIYLNKIDKSKNNSFNLINLFNLKNVNILLEEQINPSSYLNKKLIGLNLKSFFNYAIDFTNKDSLNMILKKLNKVQNIVFKKDFN